MRLELGKIKEQFVTLPKFLVSLKPVSFRYAPALIIGRLYKGYIGVLAVFTILGKWHELTIWIYNMEK